MKKIGKLFFTTRTTNVLSESKTIELLDESKVNEFTLGKDYIYEIKDKNLLKVHQWLNYTFQKEIPINSSAVAFRKNISYLHLFEPHRKNYHFLRLDITSFFHSIKTDTLRSVFQVYFENEDLDTTMKQSLIDAFINVVTYTVPSNSTNIKFRNKQILPMGFVTSPVISNIIFRQLDIQIEKLCSDNDIIYTRYADDMLFSSGKSKSYIHSDNFNQQISLIISQLNFKLNKYKTIKSKHTISINGYAIQYSKYEKQFLNLEKKEIIINEFKLSNKRTLIISKMIYMIKKGEEPRIILKKLFNYKLNPAKFMYPIRSSETIKKYYADQLLNKVTGYRAYLLSFINFDKRYQCSQESTIMKYQKIVNELNEIIKKLSIE